MHIVTTTVICPPLFTVARHLPYIFFHMHHRQSGRISASKFPDLHCVYMMAVSYSHSQPVNCWKTGPEVFPAMQPSATAIKTAGLQQLLEQMKSNASKFCSILQQQIIITISLVLTSSLNTQIQSCFTEPEVVVYES